MSHVLRLSVLTSAILSVMASAHAETTPSNRNDVMTVYATGTERDSFDAPMMVTVIKMTHLKQKRQVRSMISCVKFRGSVLLVLVALMVKISTCVVLTVAVF